MKHPLLMALALASLMGASFRARAETRRLALLVGSNAGGDARPPLRFAEEDVNKLAAVFTELGGLAPSDLWLIKGGSVAGVREALAQMRARVVSWRRRPDQRAVVLFYFSGHSDGQALEMGRERLSFAEVRGLLAATGADVRVAFVDSCRAGGLLAVKGGTPGPGFDVQLADNLASAGEAIITSSSADELSLESEEIRGSFFSHHLVSGLRGAADVSGDGQVTLAEAYQYAFARTVSASANTVIGIQHPVYDYRLSGRGDVVLTHLQRPSAVVEMPAGFDRVLLLDARRGEIVAELGPGAARRLAVAAGRYRLRAWRRDRLFGADLALASGEVRPLPASALAALAGTTSATKGPSDATELRAAPAVPDPDRRLFLVGAGLAGAATRSLTALSSVRFQLARDLPRTTTATLALASGRRSQVRESRLELLVGISQRWRRGAWSLGAGVEGGLGWAVQQVDVHPDHHSGVVTGALTAALAAAVTPRLSLALSTQLPARLIRRDARSVVLVQPAGWLGAAFGF